MADNAKYVQAQAFTLAGAGISLGATSITLTSMKQIDGVTNITMTDLGSKGFATLEPGNGTREEQIVFTGITQNANGTATLTGVSNVLFVAPYTESSGTSMSHPAGVTLVLSNTAGFYNRFASKVDDETITAVWTFDSSTGRPKLSSDVDTAVPEEFVDFGQLSRQAIAGAANASTSVKGLVQLPTQAQTDARTTTGSTGALLAITPDVVRSTLLSDYKADTGAANAYVITPVPAISAYAVGQTFTFKAANANTGASTIAISGLSTQAIKKQGTAALVEGDIASGQLCLIEYDGTNFQLLNPISTDPSGTIKMYGGSTAPAGWLLCDGTSYLNATYPGLFTVISTTYGSADGTHFNVPDMRGRVPLGVGTGTGGGASGTGLPTGGSALTAVSRASWKGEETHALTSGENGAHTHTMGFSETGGGQAVSRVIGQTSNTSGTTGTDSVGGGSSGSGTGHNNIQPVMGVNFIIRQ